MTHSGSGGVLCDRTRNWLSLELDGELSDFERALMKAHLACCDECREFECEVGAVTTALRAAPLERLEAPIALPPRRRVGTARLQLAAAAAAVVAAAALGGALGSLRGGSPGADRAPSVGSPTALPSDDQLIGDVKLALLKPPATRDLGDSKPPLPVQL